MYVFAPLSPALTTKPVSANWRRVRGRSLVHAMKSWWLFWTGSCGLVHQSAVFNCGSSWQMTRTWESAAGPESAMYDFGPPFGSLTT